ncbi:MAG: toll/interleukin-1 receptor domain-containing protein [Eubacterium sp.]|nr:toll/interleukin-1 receptor domain-containing protein [Eubacterium sp.]
MRIAAWLQRQLEHFRIPKNIQIETGKNRIGRVFRDVEELSLTTDLSQEIKEALAQTEYLIVVCSAKASASQWVEREIALFTSLHGDEKILTVLAEGEPEDVIPARLRANGKEPLSCDCRMPLKTAKREELPRLAAAMLGCSYDALRQRQRQYRARRNAVIAAGVSAAFVCVSGYLTWNNIRIRGLLRESQIASSKILARNSMETLEAGDRIRAISLALEALCGTEPGEERPETSEAVHALEESLSAYVPEGCFHIEATRTFSTQQEIYASLVSPDGAYLVVCTEQKLMVFETQSGTVVTTLPFQYQHRRDAAQPVYDRTDGFYISDGAKLMNIRFSDGAERWSLELPETEETGIRSIALVPGTDGGQVAAATYDSVVLIDPVQKTVSGKLSAEQISTETVHYRFLPSYSAGQNIQNTAEPSHPGLLPSADGKKLWICAGVAGVDYHFDQLVCWDFADGSFRILEPKQTFQMGQSVLLLPDGDLIFAGFSKREDIAGNTAVRKTLTAPQEEQRNSGKLTIVRIDHETGKAQWRKQIPYSGRTDSGVHMLLYGGNADTLQNIPEQENASQGIREQETAAQQDQVYLAVAVSEELRVFSPASGKECKAEHEPAEILSLYEETVPASGTDVAGEDTDVSCFLRSGAVTSGEALLYGFVDSAENTVRVSAEHAVTGHTMWFLMNPDRIIQYQLGSGNPEAEEFSGLKEQEEAAENAAVLTSEAGILLETAADGSGTYSWFPAGETACAWQWRKPDMASVTPAGVTADAQTIVLTERSLTDGLVTWRLVLLNAADGRAQYVTLPQPAADEKTEEKRTGMPGGMLLPDASADQILAVSSLYEDRIAYVLSGMNGSQAGIYDVADGSAKFCRIAEEPVSSPVLTWQKDTAEAVVGFSGINGTAVWMQIPVNGDELTVLPFTIAADNPVCISSDGTETAAAARGGSVIQISDAEGTEIRTTGSLQYAVFDLFLCRDDLFVLEENGRVHRYDRKSLKETAQIETVPFDEKTAGTNMKSGKESAQKRVQWEEDPDGRMLWIHCAEELAVVDLDAGCLRTSVHDCLGYSPDHGSFYVIAGGQKRMPGKLPHYTTEELIQMGKEQLRETPDSTFIQEGDEN